MKSGTEARKLEAAIKKRTRAEKEKMMLRA